MPKTDTCACYLDRAHGQRGPLLRKIYGERGVSDPDLDKFALEFSGLKNSADLTAEHFRLLSKKSKHFHPGKFAFQRRHLERLAKARIAFWPDNALSEDAFIIALRKIFGRTPIAMHQLSLLLRLISPDRYPLFAAFTRSSFFPLHGATEVDAYLNYRNDLLAIKQHHATDLNVAQVDHALWIIYMYKKHRWGNFSVMPQVVAEFDSDAFLRKLRLRALDLSEIFCGGDIVAKGLFIEAYNPRDAGKFYAEAMESEVARLYSAKVRKPWVQQATGFGKKLDELSLRDDRVRTIEKQLRAAWEIRCKCVHPRVMAGTQKAYYQTEVKKILEAFHALKALAS